MTVIGIDIQGTQIVYVVLSDEAAGGPIPYGRIELSEGREQSHIKGTFAALRAQCERHKPTKVVLRKKPDTGKHAAGPTAMKLEALVLLLDVDVAFVTPQKLKKVDAAGVDSVPKYAADAYLCSFSGLG